jgi:hypothetical protein
MTRGTHRSGVPRFPFADRPRLWGVAVSHYQVEGGDECDWSDWERRGFTRGGACGEAVDSWLRYEEDAALARAAGANAFRFSVSWSRVEPFPGVFDHFALDRYRRFVDRLIALGLEPVVTLFHYTHPLWFHQLSPWTSTQSVTASPGADTRRGSGATRSSSKPRRRKARMHCFAPRFTRKLHRLDASLRRAL